MWSPGRLWDVGAGHGGEAGDLAKRERKMTSKGLAYAVQTKESQFSARFRDGVERWLRLRAWWRTLKMSASCKVLGCLCWRRWVQVQQQSPGQSDSFATQMYLNRLPVPEPGVFKGDPMQYSGWRHTFNTLIGSRGIPPAEWVHYLKRYFGGAAREAVEGFLLLSSDAAYDKALELLDQRYGDSFTIADAFKD